MRSMTVAPGWHRSISDQRLPRAALSHDTEFQNLVQPSNCSGRSRKVLRSTVLVLSRMNILSRRAIDCSIACRKVEQSVPILSSSCIESSDRSRTSTTSSSGKDLPPVPVGTKQAGPSSCSVVVVWVCLTHGAAERP